MSSTLNSVWLCRLGGDEFFSNVKLDDDNVEFVRADSIKPMHMQVLGRAKRDKYYGVKRLTDSELGILKNALYAMAGDFIDNHFVIYRIKDIRDLRNYLTLQEFNPIADMRRDAEATAFFRNCIACDVNPFERPVYKKNPAAMAMLDALIKSGMTASRVVIRDVTDADWNELCELFRTGKAAPDQASATEIGELTTDRQKLCEKFCEGVADHLLDGASLQAVFNATERLMSSIDTNGVKMKRVDSMIRECFVAIQKELRS